jgi:hypothetical protein
MDTRTVQSRKDLIMMIRHTAGNLSSTFVSALVGFAVLTTGALAQTAPTTPGQAPSAAPSTSQPAMPVNSPEDCLKAAFDIAQTAEDKKLADDQLAKIEDLLTKMEGHCDAKQFNEAASVGSDLKSLIQKQ